jgi:hypothetical protein
MALNERLLNQQHLLKSAFDLKKLANATEGSLKNILV